MAKNDSLIINEQTEAQHQEFVTVAQKLATLKEQEANLKEQIAEQTQILDAMIKTTPYKSITFSEQKIKMIWVPEDKRVKPNYQKTYAAYRGELDEDQWWVMTPQLNEELINEVFGERVITDETKVKAHFKITKLK